jgi:predicted metal-dependent phosphoesterase TrpH
VRPRFRPSALAFLGTALAAALLAISSEARDTRVRRPLRVPDIPGYVTLRCDFHTHTVFSDGSVWPDIRSEEAWREGYDAIAITDHIEYQPHKDDLPTNHDRPFEIAAPLGEKLGVLVLRGSEVTRKMPPGHLNAIFLKTSKPLETAEWRDALEAARAQGAFLFWNHPGWRGHQKDGVARWYPEHTEILEAGLMDGIEVANDREYYPEAHRWALEKGLAILANSDIHAPSNLAWHVHEGDRRPVTLVFAKERSEEGIREALLARRSAAWADGKLAGREEQLRPLVAAAVTVENPKLAVRAGDEGYVRLRNDSDLRLVLEGEGAAGEVSVPVSK